MTNLASAINYVREQATAQSEAGALPGYLAGVYHAGEQAVVAVGSANTATGMPMREDTGFLFGSITKVMTATLVIQHVEEGTIDLDEKVVAYLPEFRLLDEGAAERIRVRDLVTATNGIDADLFFLDANGPDALQTYVGELGRHCGALFNPGERVSYSNGGMIVAGRMLEVVTGTRYHDLLGRRVYAPAGMVDSSTSAEDAILRSTAVGHFPDPTGEHLRPTDMFKLPDSWAPAGGTAIGTIDDLLAFGRTHLRDGLSPEGDRLLSTEWAARMREMVHRAGAVAGGVGLGWLLMPMGDATVVTMSGASPGGVALLTIIPEHDFAFAAFGNTPGAFPLHDQLQLWLVREHLGIEVPRLLPDPSPGTVEDLARYTGRYRSDQSRVDVEVVDGELQETFTYEPQDAEQHRIFREFVGGTTEAPPQRYTPVGDGLFAPVGIPPEAFDGYLRQLLISYDELAGGKARFRTAGGRVTRRSET